LSGVQLISADMPPTWSKITIEYNGRIINGAYRISEKTVVVRLRGIVKEVPRGGLTPLYLAKMLLRELAREGKA